MTSDNELIAEGKVTENQLKGYQMEDSQIEESFANIEEHPNSCTCRSCEDRADQMQANLEYNMGVYASMKKDFEEYYYEFNKD